MNPSANSRRFAPDNSSTDAPDDSESPQLEDTILQIENRLRSELLDDRARALDRWFDATAIVLTFFGIVIALAGFVTFRNFRKIEKEAREHLRKIEGKR